MTRPGKKWRVAKPACNALKFGKTTIMTAQLSNAPDPYRKDNLVFTGFRDGFDRCGNGSKSRNHGIH